jgi:hypothetical protein
VLYLRLIILFVRDNILINSETFLMTDYENIKIKPTQSMCIYRDNYLRLYCLPVHHLRSRWISSLRRPRLLMMMRRENTKHEKSICPAHRWSMSCKDRLVIQPLTAILLTDSNTSAAASRFIGAANRRELALFSEQTDHFPSPFSYAQTHSREETKSFLDLSHFCWPAWKFHQFRIRG